MKVHEYQARQLLGDCNVNFLPSRTARTAEEARQAFSALAMPACVVKAQVYAGGRGKAGFVKLVKSAEEAYAAADFMLGNRMVSVQTGPEGVPVSTVMITPAVDIAREYYIAITVDRAKNTATLITSAEGGVEIEEVAKKTPEKVIKIPLHPTLGLLPFMAGDVASRLGFEGQLAKDAAKLVAAMAKAFYRYDASLVEVNPLVVTKQGQLLALDAKVTVDDNAAYRQKTIADMTDESQEKPLDVRARNANLNYIALDGTIGCLVNGAGLAMATMDIIKLYGAEPANFLDVGGSVTADGAIEAFRIILSDEKVKGVLVNIFGGIAKCDLVAEALVKAGQEVGFKVPVVVRLEGTNVERAREILAGARGDLPTLLVASDLDDAAQKVVDAVKKVA